MPTSNDNPVSSFYHALLSGANTLATTFVVHLLHSRIEPELAYETLQASIIASKVFQARMVDPSRCALAGAGS